MKCGGTQSWSLAGTNKKVGTEYRIIHWVPVSVTLSFSTLSDNENESC